MELLKLQVEELKKMNAPKTCSHLWNQDIQRDQEIFLDPDGINHGEKPAKASCILPGINIKYLWKIKAFQYIHITLFLS